MSLNETPRGTRLHIGLFGKRNSGKSSLVNALTNQQISVVSDVAGTTTDPVYKSMEIHGIGPVVFIDTAGFDDEGELGGKRIMQTRNALDKTDVAILIFGASPDESDRQWVRLFTQQNTPFIPVINKTDILENPAELEKEVVSLCKRDVVLVSAKTGEGIEQLRNKLIGSVPDDFGERRITGDLCSDGDIVLLVMPQDIQAPKGRLILPQVQTFKRAA